MNRVYILPDAGDFSPGLGSDRQQSLYTNVMVRDCIQTDDWIIENEEEKEITYRKGAKTKKQANARQGQTSHFFLQIIEALR